MIQGDISNDGSKLSIEARMAKLEIEVSENKSTIDENKRV